MQRSQYACNIDGLISVDPVFIQKMVEINGPVTLSNGTVLTGENTAEYMLNTIYKDVPVTQQDEYFEYIAKTVMDGAFGNMTVDKMMKVAQSIGDLARTATSTPTRSTMTKRSTSKVLDSPRMRLRARPIRKRAFTSASRILRRWVGISTVPAK